MKDRLFRKVSLERLSSPEQLDQLMQITSPRDWIVLVGLGALLLTSLLWGALGTIRTDVQGQAFLIKRGGVYRVVSFGSGEVTKIDVDVGAPVKAGQVVAWIAQPALADQIRDAYEQVSQSEEDLQFLTAFYDRATKLETVSFRQQKANLDDQIKQNNDRLTWLNELLATQKALWEKGLVTKQTYMSTVDQINSTRQQIQGSEEKLDEMRVQVNSLLKQRDEGLFDAEVKVREARLKLDALTDQSDLQTKVTCPYEGRVVDVRVQAHEMVSEGAAIVNVELTGEELMAVAFLSAFDGKKVTSGMEVRLSPSIVKQEEYGYMLGRVTSVSGFPATSDSLLSLLGNADLVKQIMSPEPPIQIFVELSRNLHTPSGYEWSSRRGPPIKFTSGTVCQVGITTSQDPPYRLVVPYLKKTLGV
ncbi:MAG: NHLP bacteriocin system secretion protein [Acidobacteriota bacterium]